MTKESVPSYITAYQIGFNEETGHTVYFKQRIQCHKKGDLEVATSQKLQPLWLGLKIEGSYSLEHTDRGLQL